MRTSPEKRLRAFVGVCAVHCTVVLASLAAASCFRMTHDSLVGAGIACALAAVVSFSVELPFALSLGSVAARALAACIAVVAMALTAWAAVSGIRTSRTQFIVAAALAAAADAAAAGAALAASRRPPGEPVPDS